MPEQIAYDEAMRFLLKRLQFQDPELQQGMVEMVNISTKTGPLEVPRGIQGGFATVYKFRTKSGQHRALRALTSLCYKICSSATRGLVPTLLLTFLALLLILNTTSKAS